MLSQQSCHHVNRGTVANPLSSASSIVLKRTDLQSQFKWNRVSDGCPRGAIGLSAIDCVVVKVLYLCL